MENKLFISDGRQHKINQYVTKKMLVSLTIINCVIPTFYRCNCSVGCLELNRILLRKTELINGLKTLLISPYFVNVT